MRVSLSTNIGLSPETVWTEVQTASLLTYIAWPLVRFGSVGNELFETFQPNGRYQVKLRLFGILPFGTQWIVTSVYEPISDEWPKQLRDNGYSALIEKWGHWITIAPDGNGGTIYGDDVEISAGILTPVIWSFAQVFYRHRQRRWRGLARTLRARRFIAHEMAQFRTARTGNDPAFAWDALERAHIVSQPYLGPHLANHWTMLAFAVDLRDWREAFGQILRLALAPLGALTGRIPAGNTGRSNVSAFKAMPIPKDLRSAMTKPEQ